MKLLIVEDDRGLAGGISFSMERDGHEVLCAGTISSAWKIFEREMPDAVLLDLNLPDGDGMELCREIRRKYRTPILMLTARDLETDEVQGLLSGADDYLTKPFSLAVLKARLDAVLRRALESRRGSDPQNRGEEISAWNSPRYIGEDISAWGDPQSRREERWRGSDPRRSEAAEERWRERPGGRKDLSGEEGADVLAVGEIRLLPGRIKVFRGEKEIECSATEFRLLYYFMKNRGQVLLKDQILEQVWDRAGSFVDENTLQVTVGRLRRKLEEDPSAPVYLRTVHGMGYIFVDGTRRE